MTRRKDIAGELARGISKPGNVIAAKFDRSSPFGVFDLPGTKFSDRRICLRFPDPTEHISEVDVSYLQDLQNLKQPLTEGLWRWGVNKSPKTRFGTVRSLNFGFCSYLRTAGLQDVNLESVDRSLLIGFLNWLNRPNARSKGPFEVATRANLLKALRAALRGLSESKVWRSLAIAVLSEVPQNPWPGRKRKSRPIERLADEVLEQIKEAVATELTNTAAMLEQGKSLLAEGAAILRLSDAVTTPPDYSSEATCLAALSAVFPGVVPDLPQLDRVDPSLRHAVTRLGLTELTKFLYPTSRLLVPFVLRVALATAKNSETIQELCWSDIEPEEVFGTPYLRFRGSKARASVDPIVMVPADNDEPFGLGNVLQMLRSWSERIAPLAPPRYRDRVFLYVQITRTKYPRSFGHNPNGVINISWLKSLGSFRRQHRLPPFSLRQIRTTILDQAHQDSGDVAELQRLAGHLKKATGWDHYTSDGTRKRYQERLGEVFVLRQRWFESGGRIDPRIRRCAEDKGAATPGFLCFDPYDSPQPGQVKDRLCSAYGKCPGCPMAAACISDPVSVAHYNGLRPAIINAKSEMSPETWLSQWGETLQELDALLKKIPCDVALQARAIKSNLPTVG